MDKIKAFFQNTIVKIAAWVLLILAAVVLIIGGVTAEGLTSGIVLVVGIVDAVSALVIYISGKIKEL